MRSASFWLRKTTVVGLGLILVGLGRTGDAATPKRVTIFTGANVHFAPFYIADAKGYFKAEGVDATVIPFSSGAAAVEAFRAGRGEIVEAGDFPSMKLWALGDAVGVAAALWSDDNAVVVAKREIQRAADLRGKRVATKLGATHEFFLYKYLASGGLGKEDVKVMDLPPPEQIIALDKGEIDAFAWDQQGARKSIEVSGDRVHVLATGKGYFREWVVVSANPQWARENREALVRVLRAVRRANQLIKEQPAEARAITVRVSGVDPRVVDSLFPILKFVLEYTKVFRADMDAMAGFMIGLKALAKPIDWNMQFDASFLKAVDPALVE